MNDSIKNVAVCFSGQPRTWRIAKENILKYYTFEKNVNVDFFIHTWDTNEYKSITNPFNRIEEKVSENELEEIKKAFNPKYAELEIYNRDEMPNPFCSLFYSFKKSIWLKRKYEIENDFRYDVVIKARFDVNYMQEGLCNFRYPYSKFYIPHEIQNLVAYSNTRITRFPTEFNYPCFDDVSFYANSPTMDIISNCYDYYNDIRNDEMYKFCNKKFVENHAYFYGPGTLLYRYLIENGIHPENIRTVYYYIIRKEIEELKMDGIENWKDIRDFSLEWYNSTINSVRTIGKNSVLYKYKNKLI